MERLSGRDPESLIYRLRETIYAYCDVTGLKARLLSSLLGPNPAEERELGRFGLTSREVEVLRLVAQGKTNKEIASDLHISPLTVRTHLEHVYRKLGVGSRTEAAAFVLRAPDLSGSVGG